MSEKINRKITTLYIPEPMILELLKGSNICFIQGGEEFHLRPKTAGVFLSREEFERLKADAVWSRSDVMEYLNKEIVHDVDNEG